MRSNTAYSNPLNPSVGTVSIRTVHWLGPIKWLVLGWRDIHHAGVVSITHGLVLSFCGAAIVAFTRDQFWILAGALSGFMVIAPVLATSLYALSRAIEKGEPATWDLIAQTWLNWQHHRFNHWSDDYWRMLRFGILLAGATATWIVTSAALITLLSPTPIQTPADFVHHIILAPEGWLFEIWLALGAFLTAPMFASSVVTMPMLLDRSVTVRTAVLTSWRVVLANPVVMAWWAALIMGFTVLGLASLLLGLILVIPMLGHASWHAYRDLVEITDTHPSQLVVSPESEQF
jgi:uncharacterized membrane protein